MRSARPTHARLLHAGQYTPAPFERVHAVQAWLQTYIMDRHREGGLPVPPPVLTRLHQVLSDAMLGYEQCRCATTLLSSRTMKYASLC